MPTVDLSRNLQTIVDGNTSVFRYGATIYPESRHEDPTIIGFTAEIDEDTALFNRAGDYLAAYSAQSPEIESRISVHDEFLESIVKVLKTQESVVNDGDSSRFIKGHYVNSVAGLQLLNKKIVDYGKDKLTFTLHEDIAMFSTRLANLYNNLVYSYDSGRIMLPENLTKFNLRLKFSEIRNLRGAANYDLDTYLRENVTCVIYTLWDCHFDFFSGVPFDDSIVQSGVNASLPGYSSLSFDIYYKSVSRYTRTPLLRDVPALDDSMPNLGISSDYSGSSGSADVSNSLLDPSGNPYQGLNVDGATAIGRTPGFLNENSKKPGTLDEATSIDDDIVLLIEKRENAFGVTADADMERPGGYTTPNALGGPKLYDPAKADGLPPNPFDEDSGAADVDGLGDVYQGEKGLLAKLSKTTSNTVSTLTKRGINELRAKRNKLLQQLVYDVRKRLNFVDDKIVPNNVYYDTTTFGEELGRRLGAETGFTITSSVLGSLTSI